MNITFSFNDYQEGLRSRQYIPPKYFSPYMQVDIGVYKSLEDNLKRRKIDVVGALEGALARIGNKKFFKYYPLQHKMLSYSMLSFPAYRFILPEIIASDWLAIVDWRKFHRDHVIHQPMVAYVVLKMLTGGGDKTKALQIDGKSLLDLSVNEIMKKEGTGYIFDHLRSVGVKKDSPIFENGDIARVLWSKLFKEAAYLAASFHDMGYSWQYINSMSNRLAHAGFIKDAPNSDAERLVESFGGRLLFYPFNGYRLQNAHTPSNWKERIVKLTSIALRKSHGLPGAIAFLYLNDVIRDYPLDNTDPLRQFCVEWAAMAILMHDMPKLYWGNSDNETPDNPHLRLRFDVDPLSSVLTLADVIQDFSRLKVQFKDVNDDENDVFLNYDLPTNSTTLDLNNVRTGGSLKIQYSMDKENDLAMKRKFLPEEEKEYFDPQYGYLDLSALGIHKVEMEAILND